MFLTITIDTNKKKNKPNMKINKSRINAAAGWRKVVHAQKRGIVLKVKQWRKKMLKPEYKLAGQRVMF